MTTTKAPDPHLENLEVSSWLTDLHMECYKKHLEGYETIKSLLDLRESDIKKLGVANSNDRAIIMSSLANIKGTTLEESTTVSVPVTQIPEHKSLLRKGSLRKLNIKSLLGSSTSKKNKSAKKTTDNFRVCELPPVPATPTTDTEDTTRPLDNQTNITALSSSASNKLSSSGIADYEELPDAISPLVRSMTVDTKPFQVPRQPAIENEYVPSPENSPKFNSQRQRANTIANAYTQDHTFPYTHKGGGISHSINSTPELMLHHQTDQSFEDDSLGQLTHKHLSVISMESGLSFGYDVEKDFNPAQPLESQPWFHGKISRIDAEALLHEDGDFLVRENTTMSNTFTLTLRWRGVADHTLIGTTEVISTTSFIRESAIKYQFDSGAFDSIPELIYNHLKYLIPIDKDQHTLITNPVCRSGSAGKSGMFSNLGVYAPVQRSNFSPESSPATASSRGSLKGRSESPSEGIRHRSMYRSPYESPRDTPPRYVITPPRDRLSKHLSNSSGNILEASKDEIELSHRNVISPPPSSGTRAMTLPNANFRQPASYTVNPLQDQSGNTAGNHQRVDSFGDYEVMESVSILNESPSINRKMGSQPTDDYIRKSQTVSAGSRERESVLMNSLNRPRNRERVKYAEIRYPQGKDGTNRAGVIINSGSSSVNYAEVRFPRSNTISTPPQQPHPFSVYDTVTSGRREATPPLQQESGAYQSRARVLAQRLQGEPTYSTPNTSASAKNMKRNESSPHPFSGNYVSIQFPRKTSVPSTHGHTPNSSPSTHGHTSNSSPSTGSSNQVPLMQTNTVLYARPDKSHLASRTQELSSSSDSLISGASGSLPNNSPASKRVIGSSLLHSHTPSAKVHRDLPGYESLVKAHTILQNHSSDEMAYHMTRTDAVCFMLAPRPGEDQSVWKERVQQVSSSSGIFCGLQTLADPDGEKLWKKLYFRHLNLSQLVTLTVITAGDALERARLLRRYIEMAQLLQSQKYGNLFSFIGVMQGLAAPQLSDMSEVWDLLNSHFPEEMATYKGLQSTISAIDQGQMVLPHEHLTIPPIQHLKPVFNFTEQKMSGFSPNRQDCSIVGEFLNTTSGFGALRVIISNTAQFTVNAWKKLRDLKYNVTLMEFLMQDFTRIYLQSLNVHNDDPLERRRRLGLLMDALVDRVESSESV